MIYASATSLATSLTPAEVADGYLYPAIERIREVSVIVAVGVIRAAQKAGVDRELEIRGISDAAELEDWVRSRMYDPHSETGSSERDVKAASASASADAGATVCENGRSTSVSSNGTATKSDEKTQREKSHL